MADKNFGPQYLTADGRFTKERPNWMRPKGCEKPEPEVAKYQVRTLSEGTAQKIAKVLHVMLNDSSPKKR